MMFKHITEQMMAHLMSTLVAAFVLVIIWVIFYLLFARKFESGKPRRRFKYRLIYVFIVIFLITLTRIWIEGFTHIFAVLSLVAAGIVVTNKETIMNFVGWLIIIWRSSFSEGDFVSLQNYQGYVADIGPLYFKIYEVSDTVFHRVTGRTIKLPNALVITTPIISLSSEQSLCHFSVPIKLLIDDQVFSSLEVIRSIINTILETKYAKGLMAAKERLLKRKKLLAKLIDPVADIHLQPIKIENQLECTVSFYCFPKDFEMIKQEFSRALLKARLNKTIHLSDN